MTQSNTIEITPSFKVGVIKGLTDGQGTVTFTKKDGSTRILKCTLNPTVLPVVESADSAKPRKQSEDALSVYDIENSSWRSFRWDSVTDVDFSI